MAVPNGAKRRQNNEKSKAKRFKPNGKHGGFPPGPRFGPPAMMRDAFGPGPFPVLRPGPGPRYPMGPMFRGMGPPFMPPGMYPPRLRAPPPFMRPPFPRPFPRPPIPNLNMRKPFPNLKVNRNPQKKPNKPPDELNDMSKPWVSDEIRAENSNRQKLVKVARQSKKDGDWDRVKSSRARIQAMMREAKEKYFSRHPEQVVSKPFQINPNASSKGVDFTEDLKF